MGGHFKNFEFDGNQQFQISGHPTKMETLCIKVAKPPKSGVCLFPPVYTVQFDKQSRAEWENFGQKATPPSGDDRHFVKPTFMSKIIITVILTTTRTFLSNFQVCATKEVKIPLTWGYLCYLRNFLGRGLWHFQMSNWI